MKNFIFIIILLTGLFSLNSCKKYLDAKPDKALAVPATAKDFQALLDNNNNMNQLFPDAANVEADDYFLINSSFSNFEASAQLTYKWDPAATIERDWNYAYTNIETCNIILDGLKQSSSASISKADQDQLSGSALFFRGFNFFQLVNIFAMPYDAGSSNGGPGIPLRLNSDITQQTTRATIAESYAQLLKDLRSAARLLPMSTSVKTRPGRAAAYAALSRVYLVMQDYSRAALYADSSLAIYNKVIDYNAVDPSSATPFSQFNDEVIFHSVTNGQTAMLYPDYARVDTAFYLNYSTSDRRKQVYYTNSGDGYNAFKGSYSGNNYLPFNGFAVDELMLTRAECNARLGKESNALADLNNLLKNRYSKSAFTPYVSGTPDLLSVILKERRKELAFRGQLRWNDIRRLNFDSRFAKTLIRKVGSADFSLPPNDKRFALLIPPSVIALTGMSQNLR